jgi:phytoene dehydrogenase-like protein
VFGTHAAIQRCTVHRRRNVADHLPEAERGWVDTKLGKIFANPDPASGLRDAKALATALARKHPGAAASLREGLEKMFTVTRLGITGTLARTLTTSNPIESMISIAGTTNRNVTHWRHGQMVLRWTAAGMVNAERSFRRVKGYKQMPKLIAALRRHAHPDTAHQPEMSASRHRVHMDRHRSSTRLGTPSLAVVVPCRPEVLGQLRPPADHGVILLLRPEHHHGRRLVPIPAVRACGYPSTASHLAGPLVPARVGAGRSSRPHSGMSCPRSSTGSSTFSFAHRSNTSAARSTG